MAHTLAEQAAAYPLAAYNFRVTVGGTTMRFAKVSGLVREHQTLTYRDGLSFMDGEQIVKYFVDKYQTVTLEQGVEFVLKNFGCMVGGELFVPKIPSARMVDLANVMAPNLPHKIIGIRPGEKLHELMVPRDDSRLTLEFADHYVIRPSIRFIVDGGDYLTNRLGETGKPVDEGFKYSSDNNPWFLTLDELRQLDSQV